MHGWISHECAAIFHKLQMSENTAHIVLITIVLLTTFSIFGKSRIKAHCVRSVRWLWHCSILIHSGMQ